MKFKDDLSGGEIDIVRAAKEYREKDPETGKIRKRILVNSTKTEGSERQVLLPPYVCKALDQHLRSFVADRPDAYLFTGPKTGDVVNAQTARNAWYRARKSVPLLEEKKAPLYDLRHRAITHMAAYTKSDKTVMDMAGHSRSDTDLYYQHAINSEKEKVVDGIEDEVRDYEAGQSFENHMTDGEGGKSESVARLLDRVGTGTRMELLKAMGDEERGEVMRHLSPKTLNETFSWMLTEPDVR